MLAMRAALAALLGASMCASSAGYAVEGVELPDTTSTENLARRALFRELSAALEESSCAFYERIEALRQDDRIQNERRLLADLTDVEIYAIARACDVGLDGLTLGVDNAGSVRVVAPEGHLYGGGLLILSGRDTLALEVPLRQEDQEESAATFSDCEGTFGESPALEVIATHPIDLTWLAEGGGAVVWEGAARSCQQRQSQGAQRLVSSVAGRWFVHLEEGAVSSTLQLQQSPGPRVPAGFAGVIWDAGAPIRRSGQTSAARQRPAPSDAVVYCAGYVPEEPSLEVLLPREETAEIVATSDTDLVLLVRDADGGVYCNDDTYGLNPAVQERFPAGVLQVFVGTFSQRDASWELELR